jgi:glycosyltransferase involved in cell wall biosynthesis
LARRHGLDPDKPWMLAVAMMREGDKLASYRLLAEALRGLPDPDWQLVVAGGGPARGAVETAFAWAGADRVCFLGEVPPDDLPGLYAACDLMAWPAVNEAYGMALLEAQAAGLPVVAGCCGGVPAIVRDGETGILTGPGDAAAFAAAVHGLLGDSAARQRMAGAAAAAVVSGHGLDSAAKQLDAILREAVGA